MTPFTYRRAISAAAACADFSGDARYLAGGTSLIDLMKLGVETPAALVDLNRADNLGDIAEFAVNVLRIGAAVRMSTLARHPGVEQRFPVLYQGLLAGATPQLRNMASVAGNLLQRTRCAYFRDPSFTTCNKRVPGAGCAALGGVNSGHAVLGWSETCVAVHPSDLAVALLALDTEVVTDRRSIPLSSLHRLPGDDATRDTVLDNGELIIALLIPGGSRSHRSAYAKAPAGGFALASAAVAFDLDSGGRVASARIALGGVAHAPWRSEAGEAALVGGMPSTSLFEAAARAALAVARPLAMNGFKLPLARAVLASALTKAAAA